jgi:1-acyl-sn-glycerol-3-phosphate acyltransferase
VAVSDETLGRRVDFEADPRWSPTYRVLRGIFHALMALWFRPRVTGKEHVPTSGRVILAPVHRSNLDFGFAPFCSNRKLFFMAKHQLWRYRWFGDLLLDLGAFPVHRDAPDRASMRHAEEVLRRDQLLVLFPEGARQSGPVVGELLEGAAFLAARTGSVIVPVGIGGSDVAMPKGAKFPKPLRIRVVIGEPMSPPELNEAGRIARSRVHSATEELRERLQAVYDEARAGGR